MKKRSSLHIFFSVVKALLLREIQTRFGTQKLGYLWALIEPMSTIIIFALIKEALHPNGMPGISYPVFLASGMIAYFMFRNIVIKSMDSFTANKGLFVYKQVKPFDTILSRYLLETNLHFIIVLVFLFIGWYLGLDIECKNILGVLTAYIWLSLFGLSLGILFAVLGFFFENFKKIIGIMFLPLYFMSALFYDVSSLPPVAQKILYYNPVVHFMEMIHGNYFYGMDTKFVDYNYMLIWTIVPAFVGLWLYKKSERKIIMS
ncbi:ABC transporter permease [Caminibacter pacificus]